MEEGYTDRETIKGLSREVSFKALALELFIPGQQGSVKDSAVGKGLTSSK